MASVWRGQLRNPTGVSRRQAFIGIFCAVLSAICFASKGIFAKFLYADGWNFEAVLAVRSILALPIMFSFAVWRTGLDSLRGAPLNAILGAAAAGALCYYAGASLDFYALTLLDVGVERVLLYSYPSMVVVLYAVIYRTWPRPSMVGALAVTYLGIFLVISGFDLHVFQGNLTGSGLVLACALTMAIYYLASDRYTGVLGSIGYTLCAMTGATTCLTLQYTVRHGLVIPAFHNNDYYLMGGLVLFATTLPMLLLATAVQRLGPERTAVISTVGPPATLILGGWLLAEHLRLAQWLGVVCIISGILILEYARRRATRSGISRRSTI